jgi:hypothetical protein
MSLESFDLDDALRGLKDFQRRTVDYVFRRMWLDPDPATRFLVADEVGLGKTLVARGIIARTLAHLRDTVERIDVVYVCSNAAIAQQNVNRLNVLGDEHFAMATRLTLLPAQLHELEGNRVNFVSFTPGTTFDLKSRGGTCEERVLLYRLLRQDRTGSGTPLANFLQGHVARERFRERIRDRSTPLNETITERFLQRMAGDPDLRDRLEEVCERFARARVHVPAEDRQMQFALIGDLRNVLARVSVDALEPDLVILDEFQRFTGLLHGTDEAAELARTLMSCRTPEGDDVRVLLLSATPYKPLTLAGEDEDHQQDFLRTLGFLFDDPSQLAALEEQLRIYRNGMYGSADVEVAAARSAIERTLLSVMVRTERVGLTEKRDAMLETRQQRAMLAGEDLDQALMLSQVGGAVGASDATEYWKSAPHLLYFMKEYQLKRLMVAAADEPPDTLREAISSRREHLLSGRGVNRYRPIETRNGRLRLLLEEIVDRGQWQLLWMHPSLPYMDPGGAYARVPEFTKALVFSSWNVVPDAISALCSYEVERRMVRESGDVPGYRALHRSRPQLLRFTETRGRLTGMPALALTYPSIALARAIDPLRLSLELGDGRPAPAEEVRRAAAVVIEQLLVDAGFWPRAGDGPEDQRWYWAALAMLDRQHLTGLRVWMTSGRGWAEVLHSGDDDAGLRKHIDHFSEVADGSLDEDLGRTPDDLVDVLVDFALGSPAICAMRALRRIAPGLEIGERVLSHSAAQVAGGFRTLYNLPESIALLRGHDEDAYWRIVLHHGIDGNLQALLDEYGHHLSEWLGFSDHAPADVAAATAGAMADALSLRTAPIAADDIGVTRSGKLRFRRFRFRTRYALRFGDLRDDQERTLARVGTVRAAFNSPFRPFILSTTSVGQEGLDFHPYCHAVYHWNLPSNPVDMEQREGRVHRYKGHAVRRNVARRWGLQTLRERMNGDGDPWQVLFAAAATDRPPGGNELVPYWVYAVEGGATIERRIPMYPLSGEVGRLAGLQRGLALYRMAFGQPRQEDLLAFLATREDGGGTESDQATMRLCLEPPVSAPG